jgi:hypothetical protein
VTAVLVAPEMEALKVPELPPVRDSEAGPTVTPTGINVTVALPTVVESFRLVAVMVTLCSLAIAAGAV